MPKIYIEMDVSENLWEISLEDLRSEITKMKQMIDKINLAIQDPALKISCRFQE